MVPGVCLSPHPMGVCAGWAAPASLAASRPTQATAPGPGPTATARGWGDLGGRLAVGSASLAPRSRLSPVHSARATARKPRATFGMSPACPLIPSQQSSPGRQKLILAHLPSPLTEPSGCAAWRSVYRGRRTITGSRCGLWVRSPLELCGARPTRTLNRIPPPGVLEPSGSSYRLCSCWHGTQSVHLLSPCRLLLHAPWASKRKPLVNTVSLMEQFWAFFSRFLFVSSPR